MSIDVIHRRCLLFFFYLAIQECRFFFCAGVFFIQFLRCAWVYYSFQHWFRSFKVLQIISTASRGSSSQWKTINWDILLSLAMMPLNDEWLRDNFLLYIGCVGFFFHSFSVHFSFYCFGVQSNLCDQTLWHVTLWLSLQIQRFEARFQLNRKRSRNTNNVKIKLLFCSICSNSFPFDHFT